MPQILVMSLLCLLTTFAGCKLQQSQDTQQALNEIEKPYMPLDLKADYDHSTRQCIGAADRLDGCFCYPNIVPKLEATLRKVVSDFHYKRGIWQTLSCKNLLGQFIESLGGGWDIDFPTSNVDVLYRDFTVGYCGQCGKTKGNKTCYEAIVNGVKTKQDRWDVNYALYGTLQSLCGSDINAAWAKVRAWKALKGEWSERVWYWFQVGWGMGKNDQSIIIDSHLRRLGTPESHPMYKNCLYCPGAFNDNNPMDYKAYSHD